MVEDTTQTRFIVAMYTDDPDHDARDFQIEHTLCITSARPHRFLDGQTGFRIDDPSTFEVKPETQPENWHIDVNFGMT